LIRFRIMQQIQCIDEESREQPLFQRPTGKRLSKRFTHAG
jgi:hypothetical protein